MMHLQQRLSVQPLSTLILIHYPYCNGLRIEFAFAIFFIKVYKGHTKSKDTFKITCHGEFYVVAEVASFVVGVPVYKDHYILF